MAFNQNSVATANDTLNKRRQNAAMEHIKKLEKIYSELPKIKEINFEITSLGASYAMANLSRQSESAEKLKQQMDSLELTKQQILAENGYDKDYLEPEYICKICKDKGFVNGKLCTCMQQEILKERQNFLSYLSPAPKTNFESFSLGFYPDCIDENGVNSYRQMSQVFQYCKDFADYFSTDKKSILMCGASGLGKTHLSCAIAGECMKKGYTVMYASSQSLFSQIEQSKHDNIDIVNDILSCDLFILDDLGSEYMTSYSLSVLYNIINSRMIKNLPCIYSTNLTDQKSIRAKYGEKITSRLIGSCDTLFFSGKDIRLCNR